MLVSYELHATDVLSWLFRFLMVRLLRRMGIVLCFHDAMMLASVQVVLLGSLMTEMKQKYINHFCIIAHVRLQRKMDIVMGVKQT